MTTQRQTAKILPFRIIAFRIPAAQFLQIERQLSIASYYINADWNTNWEERDEAAHAIYDALATLREIKAQAEIKF